MDTHSPPVSTTVSQKTETELVKESTENKMSKKPRKEVQKERISKTTVRTKGKTQGLLP